MVRQLRTLLAMRRVLFWSVLVLLVTITVVSAYLVYTYVPTVGGRRG